jgi:hypothetical protein
MKLRGLPCRLSLNFHFSVPLPARAKPRAFRASDFTARAKERIAAEMRVAHDLGSSWPEIATRDGMSEKTARSWSGEDMTPTSKHDRRDTLKTIDMVGRFSKSGINFLI